MIILSIDAWSDGDGLWSWNDWYKVGEISKGEFERIELEEGFLNWFIGEGYVDEKYPLEIEDDEHNIVVMDKETGKPLYAIEYGCEY